MLNHVILAFDIAAYSMLSVANSVQSPVVVCYALGLCFSFRRIATSTFLNDIHTASYSQILVPHSTIFCKPVEWIGIVALCGHPRNTYMCSEAHVCGRTQSRGTFLFSVSIRTAGNTSMIILTMLILALCLMIDFNI